MLGQVVAAGEALGAERAGKALFPRVRPVMAGQLVGARKLLVAAWPVAGKGALAWTEEAEERQQWSVGRRLGDRERGCPIRSQCIPGTCLTHTHPSF